MSDNGNTNNNSGGMNLGEISTIRDILMGQQMTEYDRRFQQLEERVAEVLENLEGQIDRLQGETNSQSNELEKSLTSQLNGLDKALSKRLEQLENKLQQTSQKDKAKIGKLLADIGKKLMDE